jgi:hypothetical protein
MNGLTNGAKYGARGGAPGAPVLVELNARVVGFGDLEVEVLDRGRGLQGRSLAELGKEFSPLQPVGAPATAAQPAAQQQLAGSGKGVPSTASAFHNVRSARIGISDCVM